MPDLKRQRIGGRRGERMLGFGSETGTFEVQEVMAREKGGKRKYVKEEDGIDTGGKKRYSLVMSSR